jgi:hypothetical protein
MNLEIENKVKEKFNLPRFEMRYLSMTSKEVKTFVKIELLKEKSAKLTQELTNEINEIVNELPYIESSNFSYNVDRLNQFNNELQKF